MITSLAFWLTVWGIILAIGLALACSLIGGGKGQHKGDPQPFRRREHIPAPASAWPQVVPNPDDPDGMTVMPAPDPLPGDEPPAFLPAPLDPSAVLTAAEAARIHDPADDSIWDRHGILREQLWARLNAEAVGSNG